MVDDEPLRPIRVPQGRPATDPEGTGVAARAATLMAYVVALVGAGVGTLALRDGDLPTAVLVWTTTLGVAAVLVGMGTLLRAVLHLTGRVRALEARLARPSPPS